MHRQFLPSSPSHTFSRLGLYVLVPLVLSAPGSAHAQVMLPNDQLAPPLLETVDAAERWYGNGPGDDKRIRVEVRINTGDQAVPGNSYQHSQSFGNRTMQVVPILVIVDALAPKPGEIEPELNFRALSSGNLTESKQEGAIFKVVRQEAMLPGESPVTIPGAPEIVTVGWGESKYTAKRWRILVHVQCQVRPADGKPLPRPQPFAFQFSYSTSARSVDGPREWRTAWSPPFAVTTIWTADSGPTVTIPPAEDFSAGVPYALVGVLGLVALMLLFMSCGDAIVNRFRHRNAYRALCPEEEFWKKVRPLFAGCAVEDGYALSRDAIYDIVNAVKAFADAKQAGTAVGIQLSTTTADRIGEEKHNIVRGEELHRIIQPLEVAVLREGKDFKPGAAKNLLVALQKIVGGFSH